MTATDRVARALRASSHASARASSFLDELLAWLNARFAPDGPAIDADTPLFAGGRIDSIRILELIAWTERACGRQIPDVEIRMDNFGSAERIAQVFLAADDDAPR